MMEAGKCYVSQFTPEEMSEMIELVAKDRKNTKYFRRFVVSQENRTEFWD
jgi:hypothetical protein